MFRLEAFEDAGLTHDTLSAAIERHRRTSLPRLERAWAYYRNGLTPRSVRGLNGRWYRQAQEAGLPARLTQSHKPDERTHAIREVVVENDIAWRVQAMVDFVFGKPVSLRSLAASDTATVIERVLDHIWECSGGIALLQDMGTLGHVYGHVDLAVRVDEGALLAAGAAFGGEAGGSLDLDAVLAAAGRAVRIELIEPTRGVPIIDERDWRNLKAYVISTKVQRRETREPGWLADVLRAVRGASVAETDESEVVEIISPAAWHVYEDGILAWESYHNLFGGELPVVHVQNIAQPFEYEGIGEVEPLIPLQDELNVRLSDRANRVTLQSFKMYLAKGLDGLEKIPIGPGQIWHTDNPDASIESFGGDGSSPSEESHIREVREAMDKVSGVPPLSGGVVQGRIGNLSSANALRITLMGLIAKTERKRIAYGRGIARASALALTALHNAGLFRTRESDRAVRLAWPDPLPEDAQAKAMLAKAKHELGAPAGAALRELGEATNEDAVS